MGTRLEDYLVEEDVRSVINFIKKNPGTTSDNVVKQLQREGISSRITTLDTIGTLLTLGIIKDDRKGRYSHRLKYNEKFDFYDLGIELLTSSIEKIKITIRELSKDDEANKLIDDVEGYVVKCKPKRRVKTDKEDQKKE
jgi:hypothetical protein